MSHSLAKHRKVQCLCVCVAEMFWQKAMQLEAIIEPITFCLWLLPFSSLHCLCHSLHLSPPLLLVFSVCLILILLTVLS